MKNDRRRFREAVASERGVEIFAGKAGEDGLESGGAAGDRRLDFDLRDGELVRVQAPAKRAEEAVLFAGERRPFRPDDWQRHEMAVVAFEPWREPGPEKGGFSRPRVRQE